MPSDKFTRWLIAIRAWEIYDLLLKLPKPETDLVTGLNDQIALAGFSNILRLHIQWPIFNKKLSIRETHTFPKNHLEIQSYSYALIEMSKHVIIRADSAPHHERDYRGKLLSYFPHHLHDEQGRICSFSGKFENFIKLVVPYYRQ